MFKPASIEKKKKAAAVQRLPLLAYRDYFFSALSVFVTQQTAGGLGEGCERVEWFSAGRAGDLGGFGPNWQRRLKYSHQPSWHTCSSKSGPYVPPKRQSTVIAKKLADRGVTFSRLSRCCR